jgi:phage gp36-like protein
MAYAGYDDVFRRYNPIKTMVGTAQQDVATLDISSIYCSDAEGLINAYLGARYSTPVATEPLVTMLASDIAIYKLLEDRAPRIPEFAQRRYDNAIAILEKLRDGNMVLVSGSTTLLTSGDQEAWSNVQSYPPVFDNPAVTVTSEELDIVDNTGLL